MTTEPYEHATNVALFTVCRVRFRVCSPAVIAVLVR